MTALPRPAAAEAAAMRRGACPALTAPMLTGDGLLIRLNLTEGGLAPATLAALCEAAARHGNGLVEITARGSFQIRGLTPQSAVALAADVNALPVPVREGVPVECSPLAGLDQLETADPLPLVRAIRSAIAQAGLSGRLGPKVSVVVDGGGQLSLADVQADVRLEAASANEWQLRVAAEPLGHVGAAQAAGKVVNALEAIASLGISARGRDIHHSSFADSADQPGDRSTLPPSVLPDISPTGGEIGQSQTPKLLISPLVGEMSGRTEGGSVAPKHLGLIALKNGLTAVAIALPFGQCEAATLEALAVEAAGIDDFRFAPGRRLLALGSRDACETLRRQADALGFVTDPADPRLRVAACPGSPACASGHFNARQLGARVTQALPDGFEGSVHVSGCAKGCAHPLPADLVVAGTPTGIGLVRHGRAGDTPLATAPGPDAALDLLRAMLDRAAA